MPKASAEYYALEKRYLDTEAWMNGEYDPIPECARNHGLKPLNLHRRVNGSESKTTRRASNQRLTEYQEACLVAYMKRLDDMNMSPTPMLVEASTT